VPIDDTHHWRYGIRFNRMQPVDRTRWGQTEVTPDYHLTRNRGNRYEQDRESMKTWAFSGLGRNFVLHDTCATEGEGQIWDRAKEHLGTADSALIRVRRRLIAAAEALRDHGTTPPGVDQPELYKIRSCLTVLPPDANWQESLADWHYARTTEHPNPGFMGRRQILEQGAAARYADDNRAR
jgi:hypothetical protein